jgi:transcriptional regulator with XRE-family HTH domain
MDERVCRFGAMLKHWRSQRRLSQLDLGHIANVSARHIAFIETGRSKPTRAMVLTLADALEVPRAARNDLLNAAGFASVYRSSSLTDTDIVAVRAAIDWSLARHEPYPALALDRHWLLVGANATAAELLGQVGVAVGSSLLDALAPGSQLQQAIENWPTTARYLAMRLKTESRHLGGDPILDTAVSRLAVDAHGSIGAAAERLPPFATTDLKIGAHTLSFISTIAQFGTAEDIAIADLRIELMFPADEATRSLLLASATRT